MKKFNFCKKAAATILPLAMVATPLSAFAETEELSTPSGIAYSNIQTEIENYVKEREGGLASLEVSVFDGDETIYNGYFGYADIENKIPADDETVYEWGSCSKVLVWVSVMQLYEDGLIDLEADIQTYLPDGFLTKLQYDEPITMLNLMNHNAGWQEIVYSDSVTDKSDMVDLETALKNLEPYQAYKPNEHTAYSNWGTGLASLIVEKVSGEEFADYVHENIFEPLGMEHTSIYADYSDNSWVENKRNELKTYCIMQGINESYGTNINYVLYYPVGAAVSTLSDFATFGKAFTSDNCPLFENKETRDFMLSASSYYGDSDIAKNCHGFWTSEYAVQTMGHGGNTYGCSSMLQFDPVSGLGVVIMTNEVGESAFNYGIPSLLFGDYENSDRLNSTITNSTDISGVYAGTRSTPNGFLKFFSKIGGLLPLSTGENSDIYNIRFIGSELHKVADNQWILDDGNGTKMFCYESYKSGKRVLETMYAEFILVDNFYSCEVGALIGVILLSLASLIILIIKLLAKLIRKKEFTSSDKSITFIQLFYTVLGIGFILLLNVALTKSFVVTFCIIMSLIALLSLLNAVYLVYKTIKTTDLKKKILAKNIFWAICGLLQFITIIYFQLYNFWGC